MLETIEQKLVVKKTWILWVLLVLSIFFEGAFITLPLTLLILLIFYIMVQEPWVFALAFAAGFVLDIFSLNTLGLTSLFFLLFLGIIVLYQRKFEIMTTPFVLFASFVGSLVFLFVFHKEHIFPQTIISSLLAVILFVGLKWFCIKFH